MNTDVHDRVDDEKRLAALAKYGILDTPAERGFDDIAVLASQVCETPVALVSLVGGDRQWFKARAGFEALQTDLERSVCRHALGGTGILEIPDLALDERTRDNPVVSGAPHVRFYAGAPLVAPGGEVLGTLCVIDHEPRPDGLTETQRSGLAALADQVMAHLDLRRALRERDAALEEREANRSAALAEAQRLEALIATQRAVGSAEADLRTVFQIIVDAALVAVDHAEGAAVELRVGDELVYDTVSGSSWPHRGIRLPMSRTLSGLAVATERPLLCVDTQTDAQVDHAVARELGIRSMVVVPVARRGEPIGALKVQSGRPDAFSPRDVVVTQMLAGLVASAFGDEAEARSRRALRDAENRYRQTVQSVTEFAVIVTDRDGMVTEWNTGAERIFGWTAAEMRGAHASRFFTPEDRAADRLGTAMRRSIEAGRATDERWHLRADGSRFFASGEMMPLRGDAGEELGFVKIVRDRTEQHLAGLELERGREALVASERKWRGVFEDLQEGFILGRVIRDAAGRIADWRYEEVNRAWGELVGVPFERAAGRTIREVFPGIEDAWVDEFASVVETGEPIRFTRQVGELRRWYDGVCQPGVGDTFTVIFIEVTDRILAERRREALTDLGEQLAAIADPDAMPAAAAAVVGWALDAGRVGYGSVDEDGETFTVPSDWTQEGYPSLAGVHRMGLYGASGEDLRRGRTVVIPDIRRDPRTSGDVAPLERVAVRTLINHPIVENGRTVAILFVNDREPRNWTAEETDFVRDVAARTRSAIARRRAEAALRESDERYRTFVENVDVGICTLEVLFDDAGRPVDYLYLDANPAMETHAGVSNVVGRRVSEIVPGIEPYWPELYGRVALTGVPEHVQYEAKGLDRWFDIRALRIGDPKRRRVAVVFTDVSERVAAEKRRAVLNQELAHRLKNNLALVSSIVSQTLRSAPDMASARQTLNDRIQTLARAHDVLMTGRRDAGGIRDILRSACSVHDTQERIRFSGPDLALGPKAALTLSMVAHELSTNALKYGALSAEEGHVEVSWDVAIDPETLRPDLSLEWRELGGPPAAEPARKGFGTRLIEMGLSGSAERSTWIGYGEAGLHCRMVAPLGELQSDEEA